MRRGDAAVSSMNATVALESPMPGTRMVTLLSMKAIVP
jgi:hypothetical protein